MNPVLSHIDPEYRDDPSVLEISDQVVIIRGNCLEWLPRLRDLDGVFTDPPYSSGGMFRGDRSAPTKDKYQSTGIKNPFACFDGDTRDQRSYAAWFALWMQISLDACHEKAVAAVFTDWRQLATSTDAVQMGGWVLRGIVPRDKVNARPMPNSFRNQCEYIVHATKGGRKCKPTKDAVYLPGIFRMPGTSQKERRHATEKPVPLMDGLLEIVPKGGIVVDPFLGSGTTAIAAMRTGRRCIGIESNPEIFEIARMRLEKEAEA